MIKRTFKLTGSFKRDLKNHYLELVDERWATVITCLAHNIPLPPQFVDHPLQGNRQGF